MLTWPPKDPDEIVDYDGLWAARLGTDVIVTSTFTVVSGDVVIDSTSHDGATTTKAWLSGGTVGTTAVLLNRIVTAGLRTMDQTFKLKIKAK